jgi:hypothetical protein
MKNIIKSLALAAVVLVSGASFTACKKGENDPGISLRGRKARFVGEWKTTAGVTKTTSGAGTTTETYTETGVTYTSGAGSATSTWSQTLTVEKDGTFKMVENETPQGGNTTTTSAKGRWMFAGKNKDAELKNKEAVILTITEVTTTTGGSSSTTTVTNPDNGFIWTIDQLKNDEMIVKYSTSTTSAGSTTSQDVSWTFTSK